MFIKLGQNKHQRAGLNLPSSKPSGRSWSKYCPSGLGSRNVTPRPTGSTWELENLSYGAEELCYSSFFPDLCNTYLELPAVMPVQCCLNKIGP